MEEREDFPWFAENASDDDGDRREGGVQWEDEEADE